MAKTTREGKGKTGDPETAWPPCLLVGGVEWGGHLGQGVGRETQSLPGQDCLFIQGIL